MDHILVNCVIICSICVWQVLDILQNIQALDPSQHGAVAYLVQHTLEHIERRKDDSSLHAKLRSNEKEVCYSVGLIMRHKRYVYFNIYVNDCSLCNHSIHFLLVGHKRQLEGPCRVGSGRSGLQCFYVSKCQRNSETFGLHFHFQEDWTLANKKL